MSTAAFPLTVVVEAALGTNYCHHKLHWNLDIADIIGVGLKCA